MISNAAQVRQESPLPLPPPIFVDNPDRLSDLARALADAPRLAVDTESNSLYAYRERVCLIQISTDQADFLCDPLAFADRQALAFIGETFSNPSVEKVLHAAEYDVMVLRRDFGFTFTNIFDTSLAARILGWQEVGLGDILEAHFGVAVNKRYQRANWGNRPLLLEMIAYAQHDIHYLLPLRDLLYRQLETAGLLEESHELAQEITAAVWRGGQFDPEGFWRINGARTLTPSGATILRELYLYREEQASQHNTPVFKVMSDALLVEIAARAPHRFDGLRGIRGLTDGLMRRYGRGILNCVERARAHGPIRPSYKPNGRDDVLTRRFDALHAWRKERAVKRGVPSDIIMSKDALRELAEVAPRTHDQLVAMQFIGPWRLKMYGDDVLKVLSDLDGEQVTDQ